MGKCIMCEVNANQYWGGSFCETQIQNKIDIQKKVLENDSSYEKPTTRGKTIKKDFA